MGASSRVSSQKRKSGSSMKALIERRADALAAPPTGYAEGKFLSLEGLRGVLALLVCIGHLGLNTIANKVGVTVYFGLAVDVFFALSGFVLCHSNYFGRRSLRRFIVGRFARLYPLHAITLLLMMVLLSASRESVSAINAIQSAFLVHNVGLPPNLLSLNFPSWSISVEMWVSILYFFALQGKDMTFRIPLLLAAILVPMLLVPDYIKGDALNALSYLNLGIVRGIAGFSAGEIAFLLFDRYGRNLKVPAMVTHCLLACLVLFFILDKWSVITLVMFYSVLIAVLVSLAANDRVTLLSTAPFVLLGTI